MLETWNIIQPKLTDPNQIVHLWYVFTWFEVVSGLKVDLSKFELVLVKDVSNFWKWWLFWAVNNRHYQCNT